MADTLKGKTYEVWHHLRGGRLPTSAKRALCRTALLGLGVVYELASAYVPEMREEIAGWEEGRRIGIGVLPHGPYITVEKRGDRIAYLGAGLKRPLVSVLFKNLDSAILVFTGQTGAIGAVAENRVCVYGPNAVAMEATRTMLIVQTYLFPGLILSRTFKRPPTLGPGQLVVKGRILAQLTPGMLRAARR